MFNNNLCQKLIFLDYAKKKREDWQKNKEKKKKSKGIPILLNNNETF